MTPAEFKTFRESLGLSTEWVAEQTQVHERTVRQWDAGKMRTPPRVADWLRKIEERLAGAVAETLEIIDSQALPPQSVTLIRYRNNDELWRFRPDMQPLPATCHAALLSRLRRKLWERGIPSTIEYMIPEEYMIWLNGRGDNEATRAAWALKYRAQYDVEHPPKRRKEK